MEKPLESFCSFARALPASELFIDYSLDYNRKPHPAFDPDIEKLWTLRSKENINLFNKSKFRFHEYEVMRNDRGEVVNVKLNVGMTNYKDFIGTNMAPMRTEILQAGVSDYNSSQAYMADPIGVGALVETTDSYFTLMERSETVAEAPGKVCRPGGHPEPDEIDAFANKLQLIDSSLIVNEIYDSALKEIRDELNIPIDTLSAPLLLGVGFNPDTANRPSFEFYIRCSLSSDEVKEKYAQQTQLEKDETKGLKLVSKEFLLIPCLSEEQPEFWDALTHAAQCAILLYSQFSERSDALTDS